MGAVAAILSMVAGQALAAGQAACAKPKEMDALRTAAVQQRLMVAALSCDAVSLYNQFVLAYQKELQASDKALQQFFRRLNSKNGTADYHAYKTKMANGSSMTSIGDMAGYCATAKSSFDTALSAAKTTLTAFLATQGSTEESFASCPDPVQMATKAKPPAIVPVPTLKPMAVAEVMPAQAGGLNLMPGVTPAPAADAAPAPVSPAPSLAPSLPN
jgi:hypothetical protein